jgi:hypothetical protein
MKVSVVFEDGVIVVDGIARHGFDLSGHDPNWSAIQWQGDHGWIAVHHGERVWLSGISPVQPFIYMFEAFVPQVEPLLGRGTVS